jgi:phosphate transport system permease protein
MAIITENEFATRLQRRKFQGHIFHGLCLLAILIGLAMLGALLYEVLSQGLGRLNLQFITSFPSRFPERADIQAALLGSIYVVLIAGFLAFTLGVGAAIYLEEYATRSKIAAIIQTNISNLAGVPSICIWATGAGDLRAFPGNG